MHYMRISAAILAIFERDSGSDMWARCSMDFPENITHWTSKKERNKQKSQKSCFFLMNLTKILLYLRLFTSFTSLMFPFRKTQCAMLQKSTKWLVMQSAGCVLLTDRPDPPMELDLSDPAARSVRLTWIPGSDHGSPITRTGLCLLLTIMIILFFILHHTSNKSKHQTFQED